MIKIDIISGFLGAGKTTLINRLINEIYKGEKIVLIENEFGEIGIDSGFLKDSGVQISEMNSGCICCSLVGDFSKALKQVATDYSPSRIIIEPSGVGKLSDVTRAVVAAELDDAVLNSSITVVDVNKCKMYMKNFGEFFNDQISNASCILFSHTDKTTDAKLEEALGLVREHNGDAVIITTPAIELEASVLLNAIEGASSLENQIKEMLIEEAEETECPVCGHHHHDHDEECDCHEHGHHHHHDHDDECDCHEHGHHHHHDHDEECDCHEHGHHHHHDHDEECDCHEHGHHHHHDHDEECDCHEHGRHHHHDHDEECDCHEHGHHHHHDHDEECDCHEHGHHHHHHHADEIFTSWGKETVKKFAEEDIKNILNGFCDEERFGFVLRAKGIVQGVDGKWIHFDYVPGEADVRVGSSEHIGKVCVIGSNINEEAIANAFGL